MATAHSTMRPSATTTTRVSPTRSVSAAANGADRPKTRRLIDAAVEIAPWLQPNSVISGSMRMPNVARIAAAARSATKPAAATSQARCMAGSLAGRGRDGEWQKRQCSLVFCHMTPLGSRSRVALLVLEGSVLFDIGTVVTVFGPARPGTARPDLGYDLTLATAAPGPVATATGLPVVVTSGLEALASVDLVIVGGCTPATVAGQGAALDALRAAHARGARVMSICTGAFVLAHAGLLDGRRATTHWGFADRLADEFPAIDVDPDVLWVDHGDLLTSAGLSAGMDLCLHVVRGDRGAAAATAIARWNVVA